jgi:2-oxoglutarate ferredoxin oxidoreductase subunit beta
LLAAMQPPTFPVALGVLYCDPAPTYDGAVHDQVNAIKSEKGDGDFDELLRRGHTWTV